ncbi:MAG: WG repeat-containing protein [Paludibacteraceae bacterium]|nr:WG repeat-containing protein [Paludibacteraceae bacterium]
MRRIVLFILLVLNVLDGLATRLIPKDSLCPFSLQSKFCTFYENKHTGLADSLGNVLVEPIYDEIEDFNFEATQFLVIKDSVAGMVDSTGKLILPVKYKHIIYDETLFEDDKIYLTDTLSINTTYYLNTKELSSSYTPFYHKNINDNKLCLVDSNGIQVSDTFNLISPFRVGRAIAQKDSLIGYIDLTGKFTEEQSFRNDKLIYCNKDLIYIEKNKKYYYVLDSLLNVQYVFENWKAFWGFNDIFIVKKGNYWGLVRENKNITPFIYDTIQSHCIEEMSFLPHFEFENGKNSGFYTHGYRTKFLNCYCVTKKGKQYILSTTGKIITKGKFMSHESKRISLDGEIDIRTYYDERIFEKNNKYGLIDSSKVVLPARYSCIKSESGFFENKYLEFYYVFDSKHKCGITNKKGEWIIPLEYDNITCLGDHISSYGFKVQKGKYVGLFDVNGKLLLPIKYKNISYDAEKNQIVGEE